MADRLRPPGFLQSPQRFLHQTREHVRHLSVIEYVRHVIYGTPNFTLLAGDAGMPLAQKVGETLGKTIPSNPPAFANNELRVIVPQTVETKDVYIIQAMNDHPNRVLRQLKLLAIGAKGRQANRIYNIFTHLPYARQDRIDQPGAPRAAQQVAQEIFYASSHNPLKRRHETKLRTEGTLLVVDVHSEVPLERVTHDSRGRYQWANLDSAHVLAPKMQEIIARKHLDVAVAFPDEGAAKRYGNYVEIFGNGQEPAIIKKERAIDQNNVVRLSGMQEDMSAKVAGKDVFLIDDMLDTCGTTLQAARLLKQQGATSIHVVATHGVFSNSALEKLMDPAVDHVIITDSVVPTAQVLIHPKIEIASLAPLLAQVIQRIEAREPIDDLVKKMSPGFEHAYMRLRRINKYRRRTPTDMLKTA